MKFLVGIVLFPLHCCHSFKTLSVSPAQHTVYADHANAARSLLISVGCRQSSLVCACHLYINIPQNNLVCHESLLLCNLLLLSNTAFLWNYVYVRLFNQFKINII